MRWGEGAVCDAQHRLCFTDVNSGRIRTINVRGGSVNLTSGTGPKADTLFTAPSAVYAYPLDPAQRA